MGQHYEEQILQFESQNDFQTEAVAEKNYIKLKNLKATAWPRQINQARMCCHF